jgi:hypothetical protein
MARMVGNLSDVPHAHADDVRAGLDHETAVRRRPAVGYLDGISGMIGIADDVPVERGERTFAG